MKWGGRDKRVKQGGNRDEWMRVGDGTEIDRGELEECKGNPR